MIVVSLKRLIISLIIIISVTLMLLVIGLLVKGGEDWYLKLNFQNFLFWGIVVLIIQIWISASLLLSHRKILKSINRLSSFENLDSVNAEKSFKEMGGVGEEIRNVLKKINDLSSMRAYRISALNNLADLLCEGYSEPVVVTDVKGLIVTVSEKLKNRITKESGRDSINYITDIRPELKLTEVLSFIEKERAAWVASDNSKLSCTPVFDKNSALQFCIWEFETSFFAEKIKELNKSGSVSQPAYRKLKNLVNPFLKNRNKGKDKIQ